MSVLEVATVGAEHAEDVCHVVHLAFDARQPLDPPADAATETVASIATRLEQHEGLLVRLNGDPVGALVFEWVGSTLFLRRVGVVPRAQGHGVSQHLVASALQVAADRGAREVAVVAREELPRTLGFWRAQGFAEVARNSPYVEMRRTPPYVVTAAPTADDMRQVGADLGRRLSAGDLVILIGALGAGKTTFTQGIAEGLGVRGPITSPTFVIARVHPSESTGPALVHVDAYRVAGRLELDDLDLDASLEEAVTVVEWGGGLAEGLAESRVEVRLERGDDADEEARTVRLRGIGPRWAEEQW
jgi:tRNA threonylcarbamoyladenosine biosynthesis protein TsaE